ncbi:adenosylcobinamide-GDP ribazoletransferase [Desulforhopalus sp. IMCC35007]|uniref:adenosylcobinamide-GDP ribazoletransferase n=1 Tax=Desulforhopalus sp. IMCC35007 TaxID=2569543 RepID=UPI0010AE0C0E|nr:adenosylcobinamide-GDP ribazoletransferase [Desulforhopalus sp. IMCC35007]TKB11092.1 adenosylcobinamide-GDP ribazoletransferase [Desulforhopalus sp. IMCC35007]
MEEDTKLTYLERQVAAFLAALRFLTIIPVPWKAERDGEHFTSSLIYFPIIGILIGFSGWLLVVISQFFFPQPVVVVFVVSYLAFISGCLHLDGLSDSGDGLLSSRPRERALEIMKDSRVGAMGVIVTIFVLLGKYSALSSMDGHLLGPAVFFMPIAGRVAILLFMAALPYARHEGGLGLLFYTSSVKKTALFGMAVLTALLAVFALSHCFVVLFFVVVLFFFFRRWCRAKLGGATGDTLGAGCELTEMVVAMAFSVTFSLPI